MIHRGGGQFVPAPREPQKTVGSPMWAAPPGEFVSDDLARDTARFLEEIKTRTAGREGIRPQSQK
jgi:hypothetical protein